MRKKFAGKGNGTVFTSQLTLFFDKEEMAELRCHHGLKAPNEVTLCNWLETVILHVVRKELGEELQGKVAKK